MCALGAEGGKGLSKGGKAAVVVVLCLGVVHAMVTLPLHGYTIAFPGRICLNPPCLELVPLDGGGIGIKLGPLPHFVAKLSGVADDG